MEDLATVCGLDPEHVLVVPGNHDVKFYGNVGLRSLSRIPFHLYFRHPLGLSFFEHFKLSLRWMWNALCPWGHALQDKLIWRDKAKDGVALVGFDSNPLFEAFAAGKVSENQLTDFTAEMNTPRRAERWRHSLRIAVVHHHPLPIPFTSTTFGTRVAESLMVFYNAGTFLRQLGDAGIDLILHGHKHFSGFMRVSFDAPERGRQEMGSARRR